MMDAGRHPRITVHTLSEVVGLEGRAGDFQARVRHQPRYVSEDLCVGCGDCSDACPSVRPNPFDVGLKAAKAIDRPFPQAVPAAYHIDFGACLNGDFIVCERCQRVCEPKAIDFDDHETETTLDIGAVVVATGFDELDPRELLALGYGRAPNVLTGLELERMLCATGPTQGHVVRPSDHAVPKRIVFVQCVGSRGEGGRAYCSRYCCMNAVKSALLACEHEPSIEECVLLGTELRASGRGYDAFVERAGKHEQIRRRRGRPAKIQEDPMSGDLRLWVEDPASGRPEQVGADMVVLSVAALPARGSPELAGILGVELDESGFYRRRDGEVSPSETTRPGVYLAGSAGSPAIIPECVAQGGAAAAAAAVHVRESREEVAEHGHAEPRDVSGPPRVGVFVCHCGANISGVVDVQKLAAEAAQLPGVAHAAHESFACADVSQRAIEEAITTHDLTRVVVAACTPRTHEQVFREALARAGLNPYLLEMVNIRDQCTWVHAHVPGEAQKRARDQIRMGVARATRLEPLAAIEVPVIRRALVIGGGPAGIRASLDLGAQGYEVVLAEREAQIGGMLARPGLGALSGSGANGKEKLSELSAALKKSGVRVMRRTEVSAIGGYVGNFTVTLQTGAAKKSATGGTGTKAAAGSKPAKPTTEQLSVGTIVLATGAKVYDPTGRHGYGQQRNVITNLQLARQLSSEKDKMFGADGQPPANAAFIQCVGSRCAEEGMNPGCSRYCCPTTVRQALELAERGVRVTVFHRGIRTVGAGNEELYRRARGAGVIFVRMPDGVEPEVQGTKTKAQSVVSEDVNLGRAVEAPADLVVLAAGMVPDPEVTERLKEILKVPIGPDGFFLERHPELGPVETVVDGVFVCGTAVGAKSIGTSLAEAGAAAGKAGQVMARQTLCLEPTVAAVDPLRCRGCGTCVEICEFNAPSLVEGELGVEVARINEASCKGCGTCVAWCPSGAITARHFTDGQIESMLETMLQWETV
jgi:heterodisulfide reductase subunit A